MIQHRLKSDKLSDSIRLSTFRKALAKKIEMPSRNNINGHLQLIKNALNSAGLVSCGLTQRLLTPWVSADSLHLLEAW